MGICMAVAHLILSWINILRQYKKAKTPPAFFFPDNYTYKYNVLLSFSFTFFFFQKIK
jgi:hypothetical protein